MISHVKMINQVQQEVSAASVVYQNAATLFNCEAAELMEGG